MHAKMKNNATVINYFLNNGRVSKWETSYTISSDKYLLPKKNWASSTIWVPSIDRGKMALFLRPRRPYHILACISHANKAQRKSTDAVLNAKGPRVAPVEKKGGVLMGISNIIKSIDDRLGIREGKRG